MVRRIKAKLVLRLRTEGVSARQIEAQGMSRHSVIAVFDAADREGIAYDDVADLDDAEVCLHACSRGAVSTRAFACSRTGTLSTRSSRRAG